MRRDRFPIRPVVRRWRSRLRPSRPGDQTLDIRQIISPLRYDVIVRADFFIALRQQEGALQELKETARDNAYFTWFKYVECARYFPHLMNEPTLLLKRFDERITRTMTMLQSYERRGFDLNNPITLVKHPLRRAADSGTVVGQAVHAGDGCHRLALLLMDGQRLKPAMYRIRAGTGRVLDNTSLLLRQMTIPDEKYARFLSHGFVNREFDDLPPLKASIARHCPSRLDEFDRVVETHHHARQAAV